MILLRCCKLIGIIFLLILPVGVVFCNQSKQKDRLSSVLEQMSSHYYLISDHEYLTRKYGRPTVVMHKFDKVFSTVKDRDVLDEMVKIRKNIEFYIHSKRIKNTDQEVISLAYGIIEVVEGGYKKKVYNDGFGTMTVGFGNTYIYDKKTGVKRKVKRTDKISVLEGKALKEKIIREDYLFLNNFLLKYNVHVNNLSKAALISFIYNIGKDAFIRSEVAKMLSKGMISKAIKIMKSSHTTSKGILAGGLIRRRAIESSLLSSTLVHSNTIRRELASKGS